MGLRILHLTVELPYSGGPGGSTRQLHLLRRLAELGHEPVVVAPVAEGAEELDRARESLAGTGVDLRPVTRPAPAWRELARAFRRRPALVPGALGQPWYAWQFAVFREWVAPCVAELAGELRFDVAEVEHDDIAGWAGIVPSGIPKVLTAHNVTWRLWASRGEAARAPRSALLRMESLRHRRYERRHLRTYDAVIAMSAVDREELLRLGAQRVEVVPNGAAVDELVPAPDFPDPPTLVFTGSMDHPPNPEGVLWFADEVWPRVRERVPGAVLRVVGRGPQEPLAPLSGRPGVELTGPVPSVAPELARATAVTAPLLSGGGTRLKIVEAMAAGRAVVATSVGAEGLEAEPGVHLLVEDEPERFADAAVRLLTDPGLRARLAGAGRELVERRYDWRALGDELAYVLESLAGRPETAALGERHVR